MPDPVTRAVTPIAASPLVTALHEGLEPGRWRARHEWGQPHAPRDWSQGWALCRCATCMHL